MTNLAEFFITNGGSGIEDTVDLLELKNGFCIDSYTPGRLNLKSGGVFSDSPIADGRSMVDYSWATIIDTIEFRNVGSSTNSLSLASQIFDRLLIQAINYEAKGGTSPVYLGRRVQGEGQISYAQIIAFTFGNDTDFFQQPFSSIFNRIRVGDNLTISIEHSAWMENPPGSFTEVAAGNYQCFNVIANNHFETFSGTFTSWTNINAPTLSQSREFVEEGFYAADIFSATGDKGIYQDIPTDLAVSGITYTVRARIYLVSGTFRLRLTDFGGFSNPVLETTSTPGWNTITATKTLGSNGMRISLEVSGTPAESLVSWVEYCLNMGNVDDNGNEAPTTERDVFIDNKYVLNGISHVYQVSGGTWTDNHLAAGIPHAVHGGTVGDATYYGALNSLSGPFNNLIFSIIQAAAGATSYTITWEFWNGLIWTALTVKDDTDQFSIEGINALCYAVPTTWTTGNLFTIFGGSAPSVTAYWIRSRVSALTGNFTDIALQGNQPLYTAKDAHIEIKANQAIGTIPALVELVEENVSDNSTVFSTNQGASVRTITGLRSAASYFRAAINLGSVQNPPWVSVAYSGVTTDAAYIHAPSGRAAYYNAPASSGILAPQVTITIARSVMQSYFGKFNVFLRIDRPVLGTDPFEVQLTSNYGTSSAVIYVVSPISSDMEMVNLGTVLIPGNSPVAGDIYDDLELILSLRPTATQDFYMTDLWLIPADEIILDSPNITITQLNGEYEAGNFSYLSLDSVRDLRTNIRSILRDVNGDYIIGGWRTIGGGSLILQTKQLQKYWFLNAYNFGGSGKMYGIPEIVNRLEINRNGRFTGLRGNDD